MNATTKIKKGELLRNVQNKLKHWLTKAEADLASSTNDELALDEIRKVVAIGVACMEQHGAIERDENETPT